MREYTAYWDEKELQAERTAEDTDEETPTPSISVSEDQTGFIHILARPVGSDRAVALTLTENPDPGVYEFQPLSDEFEFTVRLEYHSEPYPDPHMHVLDVTTPLAALEPGDQIEIGLRKSQTESPDTKSIYGQAAQVIDLSGLVPDLPVHYPDPPTVLSILVPLSEHTQPRDVLKAALLTGEIRFLSGGDDYGRLDILGRGQPLDLQWEGKSNTPALPVEYTRLNPGQDTELTVENQTLPEIQFDDIAAHNQGERISILSSALSKALDRPVPDETLEFFAAAIDEPPRDRTITVEYDSSRSDNTLTKSGTFTGTHSVYYADANQTRHQLRFRDSDGRYYILLDPNEEATTPAKVYSVSPARHWDTDLGPLIDFELSA
jgi:DNA-directed RNA polymerase subunit H (RpoH/RPB5)